jgi:membrane-associated phospholipid phosphatase
MKSSDYTLSRILSYILHPLLIPTLAISALMLQPDIHTIILPDKIKLWFISVIFLFTMVIPASSVFILLKFNAISSIELKQRNERTIPLLIASTSYMGLLYFMKPAIIPPVFLYVLYSATFALLAGLFINLVYKISLHTLGWGALAATLTVISIRSGTQMLPFVLISILLSGLIGYARLKENAHNQAQVYLGYIAGVCVVILINFLS